MVEASVDFSDEGDVGGQLPEGVWKAAVELADEIDDHVGRYRAGEIVREGLRVAIMGAPNAGKSSLLNRLAGREAAIVTEVPGTTRDVIEVDLDLGGMKVRLFDTAGLRPTVDRVEAIGVERALAAAKAADVVLEVVDLCAPQEIDRPATDGKVLRIGNKVDLAGPGASDCFDLVISAERGDGIDPLLERIAGLAREFGARTGLIPFRERHVALLRRASEALRRAAGSKGSGVELRAEELRVAADRIGRITGRVDVEDLLDVIFSRFCVGK
jgi:tRNA modification GTPase